MSEIKYVSVHERDDGKRRIKAGKGDREHSTVRMPTPNNDVEDWEQNDWVRVDYWELPEKMAKSELPDWWNDNLRADAEPAVIDKVLKTMGRR